MRLDQINAFVTAAATVLTTELGCPLSRGDLYVHQKREPVDQVVTLISFTGGVTGIVLFGMSVGTGRDLVSRMMGQEFAAFDELAQSGIAELANVIAGSTMTLLANAGQICDIAPPVIVVSRDRPATMATVPVSRLAFQLATDLGPISMQLAFK